jgi:hypothetical protein
VENIMKKKMALGLLMAGVMAVNVQAGPFGRGAHHHHRFANAVATATLADSNPASDNASNSPYQPGNSWNASDNGGTGFGAWSFAATGGGNHFIGATGEGQNPSFGLFAGGNGATDLSSATRPFTGGGLGVGQSFKMDLGSTANNLTGGNVGFNLLDGTTPVFTMEFRSGDTTWQLNDGGTDFGATGITLQANTPINFSFTFNGGSSYTVFIKEGSTTFGGTPFTASSTLTNITGVKMFSNKQGSNENFGFNNLAIVPEPSTLALLAGPVLLGGWLFLRRRRA